MKPELLAQWNELGAISEKRKTENAALDLLLDWECVKPLPELIEVRARRREKLRELLKEVETFWNETAPASEGFTVEKAIELLLFDLRRYQAAVARIFEKERDQKALLDHKAATGQECEADRQRWLACLEMTHTITAALSMKPPDEAAE